jgi:hypothetical protein
MRLMVALRQDRPPSQVWFRSVRSATVAASRKSTHGFALLPRETAVITLRVATEPQPVDVDIAGHVRLRVPRVRPAGDQKVRLVAQATSPVKVILHAETVTDVELSSNERAGFTDSS